MSEWHDPLSLRSLIAGVLVAIIGGVAVAFLVGEGKFAPRPEPNSANIRESTPESTPTPILVEVRRVKRTPSSPVVNEQPAENSSKTSAVTSRPNIPEEASWIDSKLLAKILGLFTGILSMGLYIAWALRSK